VAQFTSRLRANTPSAVAGAADLNVIPVLNMFTILIPFLVSMAAFSHLAVQTVSLPGDERADQAQLAEALPVTVLLGRDRLVLAQGDRRLAELPAQDGAPDLEGLAEALAAARAAAPLPARLVLAVEDGVRAASLVACLDCCRAAGFRDLGLAAEASGAASESAPARVTTEAPPAGGTSP